jgi:hypothetical protein
VKTSAILLKAATFLALTACAITPALAASPNSAPLLCASVRASAAKDGALDAAIAVAFGADRRFQSDEAAKSDAAPPCEVIAALLHFSGADLLVTSHTPGGLMGHADMALLSAYFLRKENGGLRLVTVKREFAGGASGWGDAGTVTAAHFGADDGLVVSGGFTEQGYTTSTASFYRFHDGGIVSLGTIPIGWSNGGAEADASKAIYVDAKIDTDPPQPDHVQIVYTRKAAGGSQTAETSWRSEHGKFTLESGTLPKEITDNFDVSPPPVLSIEDHRLGPVPAKVEAAINRDADHYAACKLIGEVILPSLSQDQPTYFVTTADACDWGAALGPIWIVATGENGHAHAVLNSGGYWIKVAGEVRHGFHDITVGAQTAGTRSNQVYAYDGTIYRKK